MAKDYFIKARVSEKELAFAKEKAQNSGMAFSDYIRNAVTRSNLALTPEILIHLEHIRTILKENRNNLSQETLNEYDKEIEMLWLSLNL